MPQIINITSEALQATIRRLLPSQQGFGIDLEASNVIQPIIDLTPTAEGQTTPEILQTAIAMGSQTAFEISGVTTQIAATPGFFRIFGTVTQNDPSGAFASGFTMSDGFSTKQIFAVVGPGKNANVVSVPYDFVVFLRSGDSINGFTDSNQGYLAGSIRQIADVNGNLVQPIGFTPQ